MLALYVEDNALDADLARRALASADPPIAVEIAATVAAAIERLSQQPARYRWVMFDLTLPDGDGFEVLKYIRSNNLTPVTLAVTGTGDELSVIRALKLGVDDYIIKQHNYLDHLATTLHASAQRVQTLQLRQPLKVLYAEDNTHDGALARLAFASSAPHIALDVVSGGDEVLNSMGSGYDVLLLDYQLTSIDALELIRLIRCSHATAIPIVIVTALGSEAIAAQALRLGVSDYVIKDSSYLQRLPSVLEFAHTKALLQTSTLQRELARASQAAAEAANLAKSRFLAAMSHEIRTPMNAVMGLVFLLRQTALSGPQEDYIHKVEESLQYLLEILNNALDLSKIEAGKMELEQADFRLETLLARIRALFSEQAKAKGLQFSIRVADEVPLDLHGDELRLRQILCNLIGNALKFTNEGSVAVNVTLKDRGPDWFDLNIRITDSGIGLTTEQQQRLFEPFSQTTPSISRNYGGSGLGLSLCKQFIQLMSGDIRVTSRAGKGSTFDFHVRLAPARHLSPRPTSTATSTTTPDQSLLEFVRDRQVLLVEDNLINQEVAEAYLRHLQIRVETCGDGAAAIRALSAHPADYYDAVLMDIQMPGMDGLETTRAMRALPQGAHIPIIAMSADAWPEDRMRSQQAGMTGFVPKPIRLTTLLEVLASMLAPPCR